MPTRQQQDRWREDRALIRRAAERVRAESNRQSAHALVGSGPIVPVARFKFVALLDELALAAGLGELPSGARRVTVELCRQILASDEQITDD